MRELFFSIVIANHNYGRFLGEAIRSVLDQSCQDFELIIVDGGSTDNSLEVIQKHASRISWWVSEPDTGQSNAFNKGFAKAKGRFLTWLNADDLLLPGTLEYARKRMASNPNIRWFTGNFLRFGPDGRIIEAKWGPWFLPKWMQRPNAPVVVFGPTSFFMRSLFEEIGGFDEKLHYCMDTDLWIRFMARGEKQARLNRYCWAFRMHELSKTAEFDDHQMDDAIKRNVQEEHHRIFNSTPYKMSTIWRIVHILWRTLTFAQAKAIWNERFLRGKPIDRL